MALFATHIRFADDCAQKRNLANTPEYTAGAIYPDSRYFTGLSREHTHTQSTPTQDEPLHDLFTGVDTHLFFDNESYNLFTHIFSDMPPIAQGNETWQLHTASKLHNDMRSYTELSHTNRLALLELPFRYTTGVYGEKAEELNNYMETIAALYANTQCNLDGYLHMFEKLGMPEQIIHGVQHAYKQLIADTTTRTQVENVYDTLLAQYT